MPDQHRVVVGIDGAPDSEGAIRWAAAEASARDVPLRLVHAFVWSEFRVPLGHSDMAPGLRAHAGQIVAEAVEIAEKFAPHVALAGLQVDGFPVPVLLAESHRAELLVIGSRGTGPLTGLLVSSTGLQLAAHAQCPVVVVRPTENALVGDRVVVGYDGSPAAVAAVEFGLDHAARHNLTVRIVAVREDGREAPGLPAHFDARTAEVVEVTGHPAELLLEWSADAQLLVVGSRGHGGFTGLLLGSVSQTMLHHASCPVAVLPPAAVDGPRAH
ncbi:universal stress protein [Kribbella sp. NPDC020789]